MLSVPGMLPVGANQEHYGNEREAAREPEKAWQVRP